MADSEPETRERRTEGPGRRLRRAREKRGLSATDAADALHLDRSTVEALDSDAFDRLPPVTFVKGYLRAYARLVKLPEEDVLAAFDAVRQPEAERPLKATVGRASGHGPGAGIVLSLVLILALGGGVWAAWRAGVLQGLSLPELPGLASLFGDRDAGQRVAQTGEDVPLRALVADPESVSGEAPQRPRSLAEPPADPVPEQRVGGGDEIRPSASDGSAETAVAGGGGTQPAAGVEPRADSMAGVEVLDFGSSETGASEAVVSDEPAVDAPALATLGQPVGDDAPAPVSAANDTTANAAAVAVTEPAPAASPELEALRFSFSGESWMEVTDARGERLLFGLIDSDDDTTVRGVPPFSLVIGDVGRVTVRYQGEPVSLEAYARGRVARFTLGD
jgi:cytoskeleton protein RodZ